MTNDPSTKQQTSDTGPLDDLPEHLVAQGSTPRPVATQPLLQQRGVQIGLGLVLALMLIGALAFLTRPPDPMSDPRPVEVTQRFVAAIEARDVNAMLALVEPTVLKREMRPELTAYIDYIEEARFENATYQLIDNDGERAHVRWTATMHYRLNYGDEIKTGERVIDSIAELIKIEGAWYLSGLALPET